MNDIEKDEIDYLFESIDLYDLQEEAYLQNIDFKGSNKKQALVINQLDDAQEVYAEHMLFLEKILGAVNLDMDDIALINIPAGKSCRFVQLKNELEFNSLIAFGVMPERLSLSINYKKYHGFNFLETNILIADSLMELMPDKKNKALLWNELKKMFDIAKNV